MGIARVERLARAMDEVERSWMPEPRVTQEQLPRERREKYNIYRHSRAGGNPAKNDAARLNAFAAQSFPIVI